MAYDPGLVDGQARDLLASKKEETENPVVFGASAVSEGFTNGKETETIRMQLNRALDRCTTLSKLIVDEAISNRESLAPIQNLLGTWTVERDQYRYVNDYGYVTAYSAKPPIPSARCPQAPQQLTEAQGGLLRSSGQPGGPGTPCGISGKNIQNGSTGEHAWVDIRGTKHVYSAALWNAKSGTCAIGDVVDVSAEEWEAIPGDTAMQDPSECTGVDVNPELLIAYKQALANLVIAISKATQYMAKLGRVDDKLRDLIEASRQLAAERGAEDEKIRQMVAESMSKRGNLNGELGSSKLVLISQRSRMIVWLLLMITTISLAVAATLSGPSRLGDFVLVTLSLVVVYWLSTVIYRWRHGY